MWTRRPVELTASGLSAIDSWGNLDDEVFSVAVDGDGNVYLSGRWANWSVSYANETQSTTRSFSLGCDTVSFTVSASISYGYPHLALTAANVGLEIGAHSRTIITQVPDEAEWLNGGFQRYYHTSDTSDTESLIRNWVNGRLYAWPMEGHLEVRCHHRHKHGGFVTSRSSLWM